MTFLVENSTGSITYLFKVKTLFSSSTRCLMNPNAHKRSNQLLVLVRRTKMHLLSTLSMWSSLQHATISPSFLPSFIQFIPLNIHRSPRRRRREARSIRVSLLKKKVQQSNPLKLLLKNCLALIWHPPQPHHSRSDDQFSSSTACYICICPHFWRRINRRSTFLVCQISCIRDIKYMLNVQYGTVDGFGTLVFQN